MATVIQTPQPGYQPQPAYQQPVYQPQPAQAPVIVVSGGNRAPAANVYGCTSPTPVKCPTTGQSTVTRTKCEISQTQWMWCIILCILGCPCPCIPCYLPTCYRVHHNCSVCNHYFGCSQ